MDAPRDADLIKNFYEILLPVAKKVFYAFFLINLKDDSLQQVFCSDLIKSYAGKSASAHQYLESLADVLFVHDHKMMVSSFYNTYNWRARLSKDITNLDSISMQYGWVRSTLIVLKRDENNDPELVVFALQNNNDEMQEKIEYVKLSGRAAWCNSNNKKMFYSAYISLVDDYYRTIISPPYMLEHIQSEGSITLAMDIALDTMVVPKYRSVMRKFFSLDYWRVQLQKSESVSCEYESIESGHCLATATAIKRSPDGVCTHVLYILEKLSPNLLSSGAETNLSADSDAVNSKITVRCFGEFEVFYEGSPISFKHYKTKELFAYLIDRRCSKVTGQKIICTLWEDDGDHNDYYQTLRKDLLNTMSKLPFKVIDSSYGALSVINDAIDCDYYSFMNGDTNVKYFGEYMEEYSWAKYTRAFLDRTLLK